MQPNLTGRRVLGVLLALLLVGISALSFPATAGPEDRLNEIQRRQAELERKIEQANGRRGKLLDRIDVVDDRRSEVESQVSDLDAELATLNGRIDRVSQRLAATQ